VKARLIDLTLTLDRRQRLVVELGDDFRKKFAELKDHDVRVEVKRYRKRRSLNANAYCWVLADKIAQATGVDKSAIYREAIKEIGGVSDIIAVTDDAVDKFRDGWSKQGVGWQTEVLDSKDGYKRVIVYYGSSTYDSKQMAALIDNLVQDAQALGIETLPPAEIARLNSQWEADNGKQRDI
jgi:hypothetical protein